MTFEEAITAYLWEHRPDVFDGAVVEFLSLSHEDSSVSEAGTWWPSESYINLKVTKGGRLRYVEVSVTSDTEEFMRQLFSYTERKVAE